MTEPMTWPPADDMASRNEELLAERMGWPDGTLDIVRQLRTAHPGWVTIWSSGGIGAWRDAGYYAWPRTYTWPQHRYIYRAGPEELHAVLELAPRPVPSWTPPGGWLPITSG